MFAPERIFRNASQRLKIQNQAFAATWMDLESLIMTEVRKRRRNIV